MADIERLLMGTETVLPEGDLAKRIAEGKPLRVKLGMDPTAPQVTLGWAVVLRKLRHFQEQGHTAVLIVGDFTAQVGDPSQRSETRQRLSAEEVRGYAEKVLDGFRRVLLPEPLEIRYNSEWLGELTMSDVLELTSKSTLAQMLERDDFQKRYRANEPISMMEFMYPLLQAMDSVAIDADIELGGSDQLWNLLVGRDVMGKYEKRPQMVMTVPLLVGTDGVQKMSQSLGNYIGVDDEPAEMFGKVMSIPDEAMGEYYRLTTELSPGEVDAILENVSTGALAAVDAKRLLASTIVDIYYPTEASTQFIAPETVRLPVTAIPGSTGESAQLEFDRVFREKGVPDEIPEFTLAAGEPIWLPGALKEAGLVSSTSEGKRLIAQGAVRLEGQPVAGEELARDDLAGQVVQVGKRRFVRFVG